MPLHVLPQPTEPSAEPLFAWMQERELIRQRRAAGLTEWTKDPYLQQGHFTNVMREYDRVSIWVQENITDAYCPPGILPLRLAVARWINNTDTLGELIDRNLMPIDGTLGELKIAAEYLYDKQLRGERVFGNGYVISAAGMQHSFYLSKIHYALVGCVGQMVGLPPLPNTLQGVTKVLADLPGWGAFMAYEIACDLRWAPDYLMNAPDIYTWANPGPGARRGLSGLGFSGKKYAVQEMRDILVEATVREWGVQWPRPLEMRDIEHSLCEWGKYRKMELGNPPRRYYRPYVAK